MQRATTAIYASAVFLMSASVAAIEPAAPSTPVLRQQINDCMTKRMAANKTLSYNEAMRACKALLQPAKDTLTANSPAPAAAKSH
jgi:hypothetical protein